MRRHAREDAWLAAKAYIARRRHDWERGIGAHASAAYTAREVCHDLAYGLRHHEPHVELEAADHLAGGPVKNALDDALSMTRAGNSSAAGSSRSPGSRNTPPGGRS